MDIRSDACRAELQQAALTLLFRLLFILYAEGAGMDYSSLEISHLGHIYETLLSLSLRIAADSVRYDPARDRYVVDADQPEVPKGSLLWQTHEGGRKAGGVYYTPGALVRHFVVTT